MRRIELDEVLERVGAPVYGVVADWLGHRQISGWGGSEDSVDLHLRHGDAAYRSDGPRVEVETRSSIPIPIERRWLLQRWLGSGLDVDDDPAFPITITVESWDGELLVDDDPQPFTFVGLRDKWIAEADVRGRRVCVQAANLEPADVALKAIADVRSMYELPHRT